VTPENRWERREDTEDTGDGVSGHRNKKKNFFVGDTYHFFDTTVALDTVATITSSDFPGGDEPRQSPVFGLPLCRSGASHDNLVTRRHSGGALGVSYVHRDAICDALGVAFE
jgi:hypothetical protein